MSGAVIAAALLLGSFGLTGCKDTSTAEKIRVGAKTATLVALADHPEKEADALLIADIVERDLASSDAITDAVIAAIVKKLVEEDKIDRRVAMIITSSAQELWVMFRPEDGRLPTDNPKVKEALAGFSAGIREAVKLSQAIGPG